LARNQFDNALFDLDIVDNSTESQFLTPLTKKDTKIVKMKIFLQTLEFCISNRFVALATVVFPYPLAKEEYHWKVDQEEKTYSVSIKGLEIFKEFKFSNVFKGYNEISLHQVNSLALKWLLTEKRNENQFVADNSPDPTEKVFQNLQTCMNQYFTAICFQGNTRSFNSTIYPNFLRPENELSFEFISEMVTNG
jgi:hypothetical protein